MNQEKILKDQEDVAEEVEVNVLTGKDIVDEYHRSLFHMDEAKSNAEHFQKSLDNAKKRYDLWQSNLEELKQVAPELIKGLEKNYEKTIKH